MNATDLYSPEKKKARIEIIPLIDVVFFLLATFVLFILSLDKIGSMTTRLPVGGKERGEDTTVFLQASDQGTVYWKQGAEGTAQLISMAEVPARLAEYSHRVAVPRVFVRGDNKAKFGTAVLLFDEVRKAGIKQVSIETVTSRPGT